MNTSTFPVDEGRGIPTEEDWARAEGALEYHRAVARKSPHYAAALDEILTRQATLRELRNALQLSQTELAETLDMSQSELSRLERRADVLLSTLSRFVAATGGRLRLVAEYPERPALEIRLASLIPHDEADLEEVEVPAPSHP